MSPSTAKSLITKLLLSCRRAFSSSSSAIAATTEKLPTVQCINRIHSYYKPRAIHEARKALREYLHATRSFPFIYADLIAQNSLFSLTKLFRKIHFSTRTFSASLRKLLRYEPINEFEFFFESIGVDYRDVPRLLPPKSFFFAEDRAVLDVACSLCQFGFPWNMLGKMYLEEPSIFRKSPAELVERLAVLRDRCGLDNLSVAGVCLAFPSLLSVGGECGCDDDEVFGDLKRVFVGLGGESCVEGNVDGWYEVCRKVRAFYELGCEKGTVGELMSAKKELFLLCTKEVLDRKVEYFCRFGVGKGDVGLLLLRSPEVLSLDLETPVVSVLGLLEHFGLDGDELGCVRRDYSHALGRNEMANLPEVMKALDLHQWCFDKIKTSNGQLLVRYSIRCPGEDIDEKFVDAWKRIESGRCSSHRITQVHFLKGVGFGENESTLKVLKRLRGAGGLLRERFDCLLRLGLTHSTLCLMIIKAPDILCQGTERLEEKVNYLCHEMEYSLQCLVAWPAFLQYDLYSRIQRRHRLFVWLREKGVYSKRYSLRYMVKSHEVIFIGCLHRIHPAVPKHYLECF